VTEVVATEWARLRVHLAERGGRVGVDDLWIAASAVALRLPVVTRDDDLDPLEGVRGPVVVKVCRREGLRRPT
jgi:predicted nucleic acid-binding protein